MSASLIGVIKPNKVKLFALVAMSVIVGGVSATSYTRQECHGRRSASAKSLLFSRSSTMQKFRRSIGLSLCQAMILISPNNPAGYRGRALWNKYSADFESTIKDLERARELDPKDFWTQETLAFLHDWHGFKREAIVDFGRAIELSPNDSQLYIGRGYAYLELHQYNDASQDFKRLASLSPNSPYGYRGLGYVEETQNHLDEALPYYEKAAAIAPRFMCENIWRIYQHKGQYQLALKAANRTIKEGFGDTGYGLRALTNIKLGNIAAAKADLKATLKSRTGWSGSYNVLQALEEHDQNYDYESLMFPFSNTHH